MTSLWAGLRDLLSGVEKPMGMPAFLKPLERLCRDGHEVDLLLVSRTPEGPFCINVDWLTQEQIVGCVIGRSRISLFVNLYRTVCAQLRRKAYDVVYAHGPYGWIASLAANRCRVPCGQRMYGLDLWHFMKDFGYWGGIRRSLNEYLCFRTKKSFLLITNDGLGGDRAYERIRKKKPYQFYFWLNGVDVCRELDADSDVLRPFLFYPARIHSWKRQDRGIRILRLLHDRGLPFYLYLPGHIFDQPYYETLCRQIEECGLSDYVIFLKQIPAARMAFYETQAVANLFFYDYSNKGNTFFETFAVGGSIVALDDGSLDAFVQDGQTGFLVSDESMAADRVEQLYRSDALRTQICEQQTARVGELISGWDERVDREIKLLADAASQTKAKATS